MTDWRSLIDKKGDKPLRDFDQLVNEVSSALTTEFGVELDRNARELPIEWADYVYEVHEAVEVYVRDWLLYKLGKAHPEWSIGISEKELAERREDVGEQIYHLIKGRGPTYSDGLENVIERVQKVLMHVENHLAPASPQSPSRPA
jgi:hypothetical protein